MGTSRQYIIGGTPEALGEKAKHISCCCCSPNNICCSDNVEERDTTPRIGSKRMSARAHGITAQSAVREGWGLDILSLLFLVAEMEEREQSWSWGRLLLPLDVVKDSHNITQ